MAHQDLTQLLVNILDKLDQLLDTKSMDSNGFRTEPVFNVNKYGLEIPDGPDFKEGYRPSDNYILDDTGCKLIRAARDYVRKKHQLPPLSRICEIVGVPPHHLTNRFQSKSNFVYYVAHANIGRQRSA